MMDKTVKNKSPRPVAPIIPPHLVDIDTRHPRDFLYRHSGTAEGILVMCFRTPARVSTERGIETAEPGCCLIHDQTLPHQHGSLPGAAEGFRNDWLMARPDIVRPWLKRYRLPLDRLLPAGRPDLLARELTAIKDELANPDEFRDEALRGLLARLFLTVHRAHRDEQRCRTRMSVAERGYYESFRRLRAELRRDAGDDDPVAVLARRLHLSPERFSALYRKFFGIAPHADRLDARLLVARRLLATTSMAVKEIVAECGWRDAYYFSRLFRRRFGLSPSAFRRTPSYDGALG